VQARPAIISEAGEYNMARVVPSDVVALIDLQFSHFKDNPASYVDRQQHFKVVPIMRLLEQVPDNLIQLTVRDYTDYLIAVSIIRNGFNMDGDTGGDGIPIDTPGHTGTNALSLLRSLLAKCPDQAPDSSIKALSFIADSNYEESLRIDISTAHTALRNGEWKAAAVMAGSVVESLLLRAILFEKKNNTSAFNAAVNAFNVAVNGRSLKTDPTHRSWSLEPFTDVSKELRIIPVKPADQCHAMRDFRNLIHPGKVERTGTRPSRGSAFVAVGAMELVIEALFSKYSAGQL